MATVTVLETVSRVYDAKNNSNPSTASTAWVAIPGLCFTIQDIPQDRNIRFDLSAQVGKAEAGMVQVALFRDGNLLEVGQAVYINLAGDLAPLACSWVDAAHGGGDHTYAVYWKVWSGTGWLGRRGDNQYVTNVPSYLIATEYAQ